MTSGCVFALESPGVAVSFTFLGPAAPSPVIFKIRFKRRSGPVWYFKNQWEAAELQLENCLLYKIHNAS